MNYNYERPKFYPEEIANFFNCYVSFVEDDCWNLPKYFNLIPDRENYSYSGYNPYSSNSKKTGGKTYFDKVSLPRDKFINDYNFACYRRSSLYKDDIIWVTPTYKPYEISSFNEGEEVYFCYSGDSSTLTKGIIIKADAGEYLVESIENTDFKKSGEREWTTYKYITRDKDILPEFSTKYIGALTPINRTPQEIADFFECCVYVCSGKNNSKGYHVWENYYDNMPRRVEELVYNGENLDEWKHGQYYCYILRDPYSFCKENEKHNFPIIDHEEDGIIYWSHENKKKSPWNYNYNNIYKLKPAYVDFSEVEGINGGLLYLPKHLRQDNTYRKTMKNRLEFVKNYEE